MVVVKGKVSVNVANGVVELRGQVSSQSSIDALEDTARQVEGVHEVHNLLHAGA